jgi:hypothetical protein
VESFGTHSHRERAVDWVTIPTQSDRRFFLCREALHTPSLAACTMQLFDSSTSSVGDRPPNIYTEASEERKGRSLPPEVLFRRSSTAATKPCIPKTPQNCRNARRSEWCEKKKCNMRPVCVVPLSKTFSHVHPFLSCGSSIRMHLAGVTDRSHCPQTEGSRAQLVKP